MVIQYPLTVLINIVQNHVNDVYAYNIICHIHTMSDMTVHVLRHKLEFSENMTKNGIA